MFLRSLLIGLVTTLLLVSLLVVSRLLNAPQEKTIELIDVEVVELTSPPPPPDFSEPDEPDDIPPPPAPDIEMASPIDDLDAPEIALSLSKVDLTTPIEAFHTDTAPAKLPTIRKSAPTQKTSKPKTTTRKPQKPKTRTTKRPTRPKTPPPTKPAPKKAYYSSSELDGIPRVIRTGRFTWPKRAKGTSGTVRLLLEINQSGRVRVIRVVSSTNPALNSAAKKVASRSKFTAPRKNGQKVKARFLKSYTLKKP